MFSTPQTASPAQKKLGWKRNTFFQESYPTKTFHEVLQVSFSAVNVQDAKGY